MNVRAAKNKKHLHKEKHKCVIRDECTSMSRIALQLKSIS